LRFFFLLLLLVGLMFELCFIFQMQARSITLEHLDLPHSVSFAPPVCFSGQKKQEVEKSLSMAIASLAQPAPASGFLGDR